MSYLRLRDYDKSIEYANLQQITSYDDGIRKDSERAGIEKAKSYLTQKFNVEEEFTDLQVYSYSQSYNAGVTIELNGQDWNANKVYAANDITVYNSIVFKAVSGNTNQSPVGTGNTWTSIGNKFDLYYTVLPCSYYKFDQYYYAGDKVYWNGKVYTCQQQGIGYYPDVNSKNIKGEYFWGTGIAYSVPAGTEISDTTYYNFGDFRCADMVYVTVDLALYLIHKRIAPANVPDLRVKAYDDAIAWLKDCAFGNVTPNLLVRTPRSGGMFRIGSNTKNINSY